MDETIIIEMAAENPPKTKRSGRYCQKIVGSIGNRYLHSDLFLQKDVAAQAIGKTKILKK
jgi:hypothetical protein